MRTTCSSETNESANRRPPALAIMMRGLALVALAVALLWPSTAEAGRVRYTIAPGDTLLGIANEYDVRVSDIRRWNDLDDDNIFVGQTLTLHTSSGSDRERDTYTVRSGDTGLAIARRLGVSGAQLARWNPSVDIDRLGVGQRLTVYTAGGGGGGGVGSPNSGRLRGGLPLDPGVGYRVRSSSRAFGTLTTVNAIRSGVARVVARYIDVPALVVRDLSFEGGGRMSPHRSHQNGLDADISYYRTDCSDECSYDAFPPEELDVEFQWYLFRTWIDEGVVEYVFVNWELQEPLYEYARARGATEEQLQTWFQYPERSRSGIIRHEPGHDDHFHVRFRP